MKAAVFYKYGNPDVISIADVAKPVPKNGEVLIQIKASSLNAYDWHLLKAAPFMTRFLGGLFKPANNIPGADIAGIVTEIGSGVTKVKVGDEVYCCLEGHAKGGLAAGGCAEFVCTKEASIALKVPSQSFEEAAGMPMAGTTAMQAIRDYAKVKPGQKVLINGASGGVGTFAVQIAKADGGEVTAVCSTGAVKLIKSLGADFIVDYKKENVAECGKQFDVIIDVAATLSVKNYRKLLKPNGICVVIGFSTMRHLISYQLVGKKDGKKIVLCTAKNKENTPLLDLNKLVETGKLRTIIDSKFSLDDTAKAMERIISGHPKGKIIIVP